MYRCFITSSPVFFSFAFTLERVQEKEEENGGEIHKICVVFLTLLK